MDAKISARAAEIVEVATRLFAERGYDGVSVRDICSALKVNSSIISYYFGAKKGLYQEVLRDALAARAEINAQAADDRLSPAEKLEAVFNAARQRQKSSPALTALLLREIARPSEEFLEILSETGQTEDALTTLLRDGQRSGAFRRGLRAEALGAMISLLLNGAGAAPAGEEDDYFQAIKTIVLEGLAAPPEDGARHFLGKQSARPRGPLGR